MGSETTGDRLYAIRLACGDGRRKAESQKDFSARVKKRTGVYYDPATISLLERMEQIWKLEDVEAFAAVDPLKREPAWLAFGAAPTSGAPTTPPTGDARKRAG